MTLDVTSLYTNIDQVEGSDFCFEFMEKRTLKSSPSYIIKKLILLILRSNTMNFLGKYYHQIKGTAMGTPMAVNFANLFMANFETKLLSEFEKQTGEKPLLWLRYIDDIFFVWQGSTESLNKFIDFCNTFADSQGYKSKIKFTSSYSSKSVNFLDTTVSIEQDGSLSTNLFCKPTASHAYLHKSSYHTPHVIKAVPFSQFMRIRRICTHFQDYWSNVNQYIQFFVKRGYNKSRLSEAANRVSLMDRNDLLQNKPKNQSLSPERIPLVINWHHKFEGISKIIHENYKKAVQSDSQFKQVFPQPPIVAFRKQKNIKDRIIRAKHWKSTSISKNSNSLITNILNQSQKVTNPVTHESFNVQSGSPSSKNVIYCAECTKCNLMYVGTTGNTLNKRFNGHRSDILCYPERCELPKHFADSESCLFERDMKISILEHITGSKYKRLQAEQMWCQKLNTFQPYGLNAKKSEYTHIHKVLHRQN